jgi:HEAT repeat protein
MKRTFLQSIKEGIQVLSRPEINKTLTFALFGFLLGIGFRVGLFSSNALVISRVGTSSLFYVYLGSSIFSIGLAAVFYLLIDRFSHEKIFYFSSFFLGTLLIILWFVLRTNPSQPWIYLCTRAFLYSVFVLADLEFWLLASDFFTNFEARRRFPFIVAAEIAGGIAAGMFISLSATQLHTVNFILISGGILVVSPIFFTKNLARHQRFLKSSFSFNWDQEESTILPSELEPRLSLQLPILLFLFWMIYTFTCYGTDYIFNTVAFNHLPHEDTLTVFFGEISTLAYAVILVYQLFLAAPLTIKVGVDRTILLVPMMMALGTALIYWRSTLLTVSIAEGLIYFFADYAAMSLLQPIFNVISKKMRGRVKILTDGVGRPVGVILLFLIALFASFHLRIEQISFILLGVTLLFLVYPFLFHRVYLKHLLTCLQSKDLSLVSNAVQALGERNKTKAVAPLLTLLDEAQGIDLKRTIVLSLGHTRSREAFRDIVALFAVPNESLQLAVLESLAHYKNYESMFALVRLMKSTHMVSFHVRLNATLVLTKLIGKRMVPFLMEALGDKDPRVKANAIESIGLLKDRKTISFLLPFLTDENHRVRANTVIALYPFRSVRKKALKTLDGLYHSQFPLARIAALHAIGVLKLRRYEENLLRLLQSSDKKVLEHASAALGQMKNSQFCKPFIRLLLDEDEKNAVETARHLGRFPSSSRLLVFEQISKLSEGERNHIYERLNKTPFDFSMEKAMMSMKNVVPTPL